MNSEKGTIQLTFVYKGESHVIQTYPNQYYSLMTLISDMLGIRGFGICCGMGSCGTCIVQLSNSYTSHKNTLLACDVPINDELANTIITIPDKFY